MFFNLNEVAADLMRDVRNQNGRNRVAVGELADDGPRVARSPRRSAAKAGARNPGLWDGIPLGFGMAARRWHRDAAAAGVIFASTKFLAGANSKL